MLGCMVNFCCMEGWHIHANTVLLNEEGIATFAAKFSVQEFS